MTTFVFRHLYKTWVPRSPLSFPFTHYFWTFDVPDHSSSFPFPVGQGWNTVIDQWVSGSSRRTSEGLSVITSSVKVGKTLGTTSDWTSRTGLQWTEMSGSSTIYRSQMVLHSVVKIVKMLQNIYLFYTTNKQKSSELTNDGTVLSKVKSHKVPTSFTVELRSVI